MTIMPRCLAVVVGCGLVLNGFGVIGATVIGASVLLTLVEDVM